MAMALRHSSSPNFYFHFLLSQNVKHRGKGNHVKLLGRVHFPYFNQLSWGLSFILDY